MKGAVILIGMMGAGKSAIGQELSRELGLPFADSDAEIERAAAMTIPEIFARDGQDFFRAREAEVIARILAGPPLILAIGGGAWMQPDNRAVIRAAGLAVFIDPPLDVLWSRVRQRTNRPLLMTDDPRETLATLLAARRPVYARAAVTVPVTAAETVEASARAVRLAVEAHSPGYLA